MADIFLNSAKFVKHKFLNVGPPSSYDLNLKALIKIPKVSWTSQLSYEILWSSFERNFNKTNFISPNKMPPQSPHLLGLICLLLQPISKPICGLQKCAKCGLSFIHTLDMVVGFNSNRYNLFEIKCIPFIVELLQP